MMKNRVKILAFVGVMSGFSLLYGMEQAPQQKKLSLEELQSFGAEFLKGMQEKTAQQEKQKEMAEKEEDDVVLKKFALSQKQMLASNPLLRQINQSFIDKLKSNSLLSTNQQLNQKFNQVAQIIESATLPDSQLVKDEFAKIKNLPEELKQRFMNQLETIYQIMLSGKKNPQKQLELPKEFTKFSTFSNFLDENTTLQEWLEKIMTTEESSDNLKAFLIQIMHSVLKNKYPYIFPFYQSGYYYLYDSDKEKMKGDRHPDIIRLEEYMKGKKYKTNEYAKKLAEKYKIHLMPKASNVYQVVDLLLSELNQNAEFQNVIERVKYHARITDNQSSKWNSKKREAEGEVVMPRVVIYPANGKENTQKALNIVYKILKGIDGIDVTPRYNQRMTNMIYVAQGDGDSKGPHSEQYFEPGMIYYKSNFTGEEVDHHLKNPAEAQ